MKMSAFGGAIRNVLLGTSILAACCAAAALLILALSLLVLLFLSRGGCEPYFQFFVVIGGLAFFIVCMPIAALIWHIRQRRRREGRFVSGMGAIWLLLLVCSGSMFLAGYLTSVALGAYDRAAAREWAEQEIARVQAYWEIHGRYPTEDEFINGFTSPPYPWDHESVLYRQDESGFSFDIVNGITGGEIWGSSTGRWVVYD